MSNESIIVKKVVGRPKKGDVDEIAYLYYTAFLNGKRTYHITVPKIDNQYNVSSSLIFEQSGFIGDIIYDVHLLVRGKTMTIFKKNDLSNVTHSRYEVFKELLTQIRKFLLDLKVVDNEFVLPDALNKILEEKKLDNKFNKLNSEYFT